MSLMIANEFYYPSSFVVVAVKNITVLEQCTMKKPTVVILWHDNWTTEWMTMIQRWDSSMLMMIILGHRIY